MEFKERMLEAPRKYIVPSIVFLLSWSLFSASKELPFCLYLLLNCSMIEELKDARKGVVYERFSLWCNSFRRFENYEIEKMRDGHVVVTTKVVNHRSIIMEMRTRLSLYPVWPSQWFGRGFSRVDGWPCNPRSITWKQGVWVMSSRSMVNVSTVDGRLSSCGCRAYQSRRGQCLQGNLYDVCYGSERWIRTSTHLKLYFDFYGTLVDIETDESSPLYGIPWLRSTNPTGQAIQEKVFAYVIESWCNKPKKIYKTWLRKNKLPTQRLIWRSSLCNCI